MEYIYIPWNDNVFGESDMKSAAPFSAAVLLCLLSACSGPLGPIPGGLLSGQTSVTPGSWDFAVDADQIQLETIDESGDAYSVNVWSGVVDGRLFIPTSLVRGAENPDDRGWVKNAVSNDSARVRIGEKVYAGQLSRVMEAELTQRVKNALMQKYDTKADARSAGAWIFEVQKRSNG